MHSGTAEFCLFTFVLSTYFTKQQVTMLLRNILRHFMNAGLDQRESIRFRK